MSQNPFNDMSDAEYERIKATDGIKVVTDASTPEAIAAATRTKDRVAPIIMKMMDDVEAASDTPMALVVVMLDKNAMGLMSNIGEDEQKSISLLKEFLAHIETRKPFSKD